jgi:ribonuclease BN (tRNA processing enzyme)
VRLTVLGKSPSWEDAGGACSAYLLEEGGHALLLDCGSGAFAKLRARRDYHEVGAVVVSHLHADHTLDLVPFAYALTYGPRRRATPPELHAPPGARAYFRRVAGAFGSDELVESAFALREYDPSAELVAGPFRLRFCAVPHFVPTWAVEVRGASGGRLTYGADSGPSEALVAFARDTDLLVSEATIPAPDPEGPAGHLTPEQAAEHARRAGARRLVLTHVSDELDGAAFRGRAARVYGGPVDLAAEGAEFEL